MCKACAGRDRALIESYWNNGLELPESAYVAGRGSFVSAKLSDAFPGPDGIGDVKTFDPLAPAGLVLVGPDDAPNTFGPGAPTVTVHPIGTAMSPATRTVGTIELNGDQDFRQITLVAGKTYEIHMYALAGGPNNVPLPDAYLELYDAAGNFVTAADGGAHTPANEVNSGFDVLLTFTAQVSGTYYINSRAFDNDPTDGSTGEGVGDYELFAREVDPNASTTYQPYYELDDPLHSIDWGSRLINKVHQTTRNPDGDEGTRGPNAGPEVRQTGNAPGDPAPYSGPNQAQTTGNPSGFPNAPATYDDPLVDSVTDADINPVGDPTPLTFDIPGKNVITVYYAREGERYKFDDPSQPGLTEIVPAAGFKPFEIDAMRNALAAYSDVADIVYIEVEQAYVNADIANPQSAGRAYADLTILLYAGTPGTGLLGRHSPPDEGNEGQGEYNNLGPGWAPGKLVPGGFSFVTLIHELGHAHGLAHPFDTGGGSSILRGVKPAVDQNGAPKPFDYTLGDYDLNQAIHTIMSYQDGWPKSPYGNAPTSAGYGYQTGLSAFDIAVIQDKYGVNETTRSGNDVYVLPEANAVAVLNPDGTVATRATGYTTIWDGGGTDEIQYNGARNATIDLRAATLKYEVGGGGWMSYTTGATPVYAGFTIANGAVIENATSGSGNDTLVGNAVNNVFNSGAGNDLVSLQAGGNDTAIMGEGNDGAYFGAAYNSADIVDGGAGTLDSIGLQGNYSGGVTLGSLSGVELVVLLPGSDARFGDTANNVYNYVITANASTIVSNNTVTIQANTLRANETFTLNAAASGIDFLVYGGAGNDLLTGGSGADGFFFGQGRFNVGDVVNGGGGALDQVGLQGNFTGGNAITFGAAQLSNVEFVVLLSAVDTRFGAAGGTAAYDITMNDGNVVSGQRFIISANSLRAGEAMTFNGASETDGSFRIFSGAGNDVITGSQNGDEIFGGLGNDVFRYTAIAESTNTDRDWIRDFRTGDTIDLSALASNTFFPSFQFIGSDTQSGIGQVRVMQTGNQATVQVYLDSDNVADLVIDVTVADNHTLTASDFDTTAESSNNEALADKRDSDGNRAAALFEKEAAAGEKFDLDLAYLGPRHELQLSLTNDLLV